MLENGCLCLDDLTVIRMKELKKQDKSSNQDFGQGNVWSHILRLAVPMTLAQLINVLYNIVDRIYIGHIPEVGTNALTGVGLCLPVLMLVWFFAGCRKSLLI